MARRMLIDASHPEETRVVVVDGTRLEEFDFETASRKPLKGNIYLAKVIRIEPSLQAAFVEYGGNRHGFLAFSEIHPDYYQIPVADRERLIAEQQRLQAEAEEEPEPHRTRVDRTDIDEVKAENLAAVAPPENASAVPGATPEAAPQAAAEEGAVAPSDEPPVGPTAATRADAALSPADVARPNEETSPEQSAQPRGFDVAGERLEAPTEPEESAEAVGHAQAVMAMDPSDIPTGATEADVVAELAEPPTPTDLAKDLPGNLLPEGPEREAMADAADAPPADVVVEILGGDEAIEQRETRERRRRNPIRQYKIQEVIKRRQILLVQVVKEERGNKGAALTTYLSLAGRYCVLMPNAGRGGGISRKISNPADRKRMKEVLSELDVPQGQGVILRTAGLERSTIDIKRDYEYLTRLWDSIRELTMRSTAPALIYEEGDLIKRSRRDVYDTDIAQVLVEGEAGYEAAAEFMRQLVPHQAGKVELYREPIPLFHRYQVESQFDAMHSPVVQLKSGGYIVINPTEALVAIDVNSGRATKERNIEETAVRTNIEAAEEIARQVRLRDLAGLIVIDFIDMEETRHQRQVEHKVKDAMRHDRARIQIGRISAFGLLELSRQRLRPSLLEHSTEICPHCAGTGRVRSIESAALHALRAVEEEGVRKRASEIVVSVPPNVALYLLNQKRHTLSEVELRYGFSVSIEADSELHAADCEIERVRGRRDERDRPALETARASYDEVAEEQASSEAGGFDAADAGEREDEDADGRDGGRRRRRRRRRRGRRDGEGEAADRPQAMGEEDRTGDEPIGEADDEGREPDGEAEGEAPHADADGVGEERGEGDRDDGDRGRRRRGRRGGRRRRRENGPDEGHQEGHQEGHEEGYAHGEASPERVNVAIPVEGRPLGGETVQDRPVQDEPVEHAAEHHIPLDQAPFGDEPTVVVQVPLPPEPAAPPALRPAPPVAAAAPQIPPDAPEPTAPPPPVVPVVPVIDTPAANPKRGWWRR
ncbi:MAG: Rne/Rng family ribonuclease [Alphaproteobacteria bacterium]|nr:Rne/Rng family ribonuclease [Alphaproteobacteria bacterium]